MPISKRSFGLSRSGAEVSCWTLSNSRGMSAEILNWGGVVRTLAVPDRDGVPTDVVLGYDSLSEYERGSSFFGAFVGRYANRIKASRFELDGASYELCPNEGENHLHGALCTRVFSAQTEGDTLVLRQTSPDGDEGYPGELLVELRYTLTEENTLIMDYTAVTTRPTVLNLTNHSYFNLAGQGNGDILDHILRLDCDRFTELDTQTLPTGRILPVEGTALDFRTPREIGSRIGEALLRPYGGYDHNLIFEKGETAGGELYCARSGIRMSLSTTQPAVQLYSGNFVRSDAVGHGKNGASYPRHAAVCLETQHYPCSPNFAHFPSTVLRQGEVYHHKTAYAFSAD